MPRSAACFAPGSAAQPRSGRRWSRSGRPARQSRHHAPQRQALGQRARQPIDQVAVVAEVGERLFQQRRRRTEARFREQRLDAGGRQRASRMARVARTATVSDRRDRRAQVRCFEVCAQILAQARLAGEVRDRIPARRSRRSVKGMTSHSAARAGTGHRAVDDREQAACRSPLKCG
jgi:hypothetical protein